jgi:hypothetical protein
VTGPPPPFSSTVATLGNGAYRDTYGGRAEGANGKLIIYVVRAGSREFLSALRVKARQYSEANYSIVYVRHSWASLNELTTRLANAAPRWQARGIVPQEWGPDPQSNSILVRLRHYSKRAAQDLESYYGKSWVSVARVSDKERPVLMDRYFDSAPFFGGDAIYYDIGNPSTVCTSGYSMVGNRTGNHFMTTAGHCPLLTGQNTWYTNFFRLFRLGAISTNYLPTSSRADFATIGPLNSAGQVWGNGTTVYNPEATPLDPVQDQSSSEPIHLTYWQSAL